MSKLTKNIFSLIVEFILSFAKIISRRTLKITKNESGQVDNNWGQYKIYG